MAKRRMRKSYNLMVQISSGFISHGDLHEHVELANLLAYLNGVHKLTVIENQLPSRDTLQLLIYFKLTTGKEIGGHHTIHPPHNGFVRNVTILILNNYDCHTRNNTMLIHNNYNYYTQNVTILIYNNYNYYTPR